MPTVNHFILNYVQTPSGLPTPTGKGLVIYISSRSIYYNKGNNKFSMLAVKANKMMIPKEFRISELIVVHNKTQ